MREKFSPSPKSKTALRKEKIISKSCLFILMNTFKGETDLQNLPGESKDLYIFTEHNELYYAPRETPTHDQRTSSSWQKYIQVPLTPQKSNELRSELLPILRKRSKSDSLDRQFTTLSPNDLTALKKITGHARKSTRGPIELERVWHRVSWLPGYLVHEFSGTGDKLRPYQKTLAYRLAWERLKGTYVKGKVAFPVFKIANFTLIKEEHCKLLMAESLALGIPPHVFQITAHPLSERSQAKLAHHVKSQPSLIDNPQAFEAYTHSESFRGNFAVWRRERQGNVQRKEPKKTFMTSPRAFRYFGNSLNYLESIEKIIERSPEFAQASVVKDVTCGSCALTFYLAQKYPEKKYIASDINGELINLLNYIKENRWEDIEKSYREHHSRCHNSPASQRNTIFNQMIVEYNEQPLPKDYSLLLFIQNNSFVNVEFAGTQIRRAYLLQERSTKLETTLKLLHHSKKLIDKGNIEFQQMDMHETLHQTNPGDICFLTPPHEHDDAKFYLQKISVNDLSTSIRQLQARQIPFLLTYGDNIEQKSTNLTSIIDGLNKYSYLASAGRKKAPKIMTVYFSQNLVSPSVLEELNRNLRLNAERLITKARKGLRALEETRASGGSSHLSETEQLYTQTLELAQQIINTFAEIPQTSSSKTMQQTIERQEGDERSIVTPQPSPVETDSESELEGEETDLEEDALVPLTAVDEEPTTSENTAAQPPDVVDIWQFSPPQRTASLEQSSETPSDLTTNNTRAESRILPSIAELFPFLCNSRRVPEEDKLNVGVEELSKRKTMTSRQTTKGSLLPDYKRARTGQYFDFFSKDSVATGTIDHETTLADETKADYESSSFPSPSLEG
ncbi:DNA adenine methylase [Legionella feeleii]|uniref:site-specific DNA-methyltransferase (adenine-specific) n=1 Tax=Legionella feeleii TaxID=453 RepID=A0A0W0UAB9_9GAMM|nr:DNA adenine methylase [Legionella feeleii]KTD04896.1 D12 class N6 adenine-specific DNA methyltransferase [Legionella feeleii]SPX62202.1 Site-specific DNA methylase [Legionella feeleii]